MLVQCCSRLKEPVAGWTVIVIFVSLLIPLYLLKPQRDVCFNSIHFATKQFHVWLLPPSVAFCWSKEWVLYVTLC